MNPDVKHGRGHIMRLQSKEVPNHIKHPAKNNSGRIHGHKNYMWMKEHHKFGLSDPMNHQEIASDKITNTKKITVRTRITVWAQKV